MSDIIQHCQDLTIMKYSNVGFRILNQVRSWLTLAWVVFTITIIYYARAYAAYLFLIFRNATTYTDVETLKITISKCDTRSGWFRRWNWFYCRYYVPRIVKVGIIRKLNLYLFGIVLLQNTSKCSVRCC